MTITRFAQTTPWAPTLIVSYLILRVIQYSAKRRQEETLHTIPILSYTQTRQPYISQCIQLLRFTSNRKLGDVALQLNKIYSIRSQGGVGWGGLDGAMGEGEIGPLICFKWSNNLKGQELLWSKALDCLKDQEFRNRKILSCFIWEVCGGVEETSM